MKLLIVDDESRVRDGLKAVIDWSAQGFSVCGEGIDGPDGLKKMLECKPDLTLLDIKMPDMNGIEVAKEARANGYSGKIIILSGYSDFPYAQSAIRFGVTAYLLKPIDEDELADAVTKAREEIEREAKALRGRQGVPLSRTDLLCDILLGRKKAAEELQAYEIYLSSGGFRAALIEFGISAGDAVQRLLWDILKQCFDDSQAELLPLDGMAALILKSDEALAMLPKAMELIRRRIGCEGKYSALAGVGRAVESIEEISLSYADAKEIIGNRFFYKGADVVDYRKNILQRFSGNAADYQPDELADDIYSCITAGEPARICARMARLEEALLRSMIKPEQIKGILANLYINLQRKMQAGCPGAQRRYLSDSQILNGIFVMDYLHDIIDYLEKEFLRLSSDFECADNGGISLKLLNYIDRNSGNDLTLESLAALFGYNCNYLGKLFKKAKGESFNAYLGKLRIQKAEALLTGSGLKVYEISEKVGYRSLNYFYKEFQRYTGVSPLEYRKRHDTPC